jgi:hypothetical protein
MFTGIQLRKLSCFTVVKKNLSLKWSNLFFVSFFRKNKLGAVVQFDDDMVKFYSHEGMFIVQVTFMIIKIVGF